MSALSPTAVAAIDDLELAARLVVDGIRSGSHRSPSHGYSAEFQQHRVYRSGDDLKYLDWKILARTDRLYSRQFRETTNMSVMLVLDASGSMAFPDGAVSKFQYSTIVAAALAYLISGQGDGVGLMTMVDGALSYVPAKGGRPHLRSLIAHIDRLRPGGQWHPERVITRGAELLKRRGVVVVISDFYDAEEETRRALRRVARRGHDAAMIQVLSAEERTFPYSGDMQFEDVESGERRVLDAGAIRERYRSALGDFLEGCQTAARRDGIDYALMETDTPPDRALRGFLLRRGARHLSHYTSRRD